MSRDQLIRAPAVRPSHGNTSQHIITLRNIFREAARCYQLVLTAGRNRHFVQRIFLSAGKLPWANVLKTVSFEEYKVSQSSRLKWSVLNTSELVCEK